MPQGRIVLKSICQSRKLAELKTDGARLLYTWLIPNVDINGCFSGDEEVIKGQIFTRLKKSTKSINGFLADLERVGLIVWYNTNGDKYLYIPDFVEKQPSLNKDREGKPTIPLPTPEQLQSTSRLTPLKVKERKVKIKQSKVNDSRFDKFWSIYPKKVGKGKAEESFLKVNPSEELFRQICSAVEQQKLSEQWQREGGRFIPNPATWLNQKRWGDEMGTSTTKRKLPVIPGRICGNCKMPAVYKSAGEYDNYYCSECMPASVKERYE